MFSFRCPAGNLRVKKPHILSFVAAEKDQFSLDGVSADVVDTLDARDVVVSEIMSSDVVLVKVDDNNSPTGSCENDLAPKLTSMAVTEDVIDYCCSRSTDTSSSIRAHSSVCSSVECSPGLTQTNPKRSLMKVFLFLFQVLVLR